VKDSWNRFLDTQSLKTLPVSHWLVCCDFLVTLFFPAVKKSRNTLFQDQTEIRNGLMSTSSSMCYK